MARLFFFKFNNLLVFYKVKISLVSCSLESAGLASIRLGVSDKNYTPPLFAIFSVRADIL